MACRCHFVVYDLSFEIFQRWFIRQPAYLDESESVIDEERVPSKRLLIFRDIKVPGLGGTKILGVKLSVFLKGLGKTHLEGVATAHGGPHLKPTDHVLTHVENISSSV